MSVLTIIAAAVSNDRSPHYMEKALAAIHQALRPGQRIVFEYGTSKGKSGAVLLPETVHVIVELFSPCWRADRRASGMLLRR